MAIIWVQSNSKPPAREFMREVPKHFDGGDIDDDGHWRGPEMSCLECKETTAMHYGITARWFIAALECGECREVFAEYTI